MPLSIVNMLAIAGAVLSVIEMGMTAYLVDASLGAERPSFMLFNSLWSMIVLAYLFVSEMKMPRLYNKYAVLGLLAVTVVFWFAGSIALAVAIRGCFGGSFCDTAKAATVFGFVLWLIFSIMLGFEVLDWSKSRRSSGAKGPHSYPGA